MCGGGAKVGSAALPVAASLRARTSGGHRPSSHSRSSLAAGPPCPGEGRARSSLRGVEPSLRAAPLYRPLALTGPGEAGRRAGEAVGARAGPGFRAAGRGGGAQDDVCAFLQAVPARERAAACQDNQIPGARHALPLSQGVEGDDGVHNDEDHDDKGAYQPGIGDIDELLAGTVLVT
eukprot:CAMPEP_0185410488 /NCGR_PEP_ID=MMETSP1365-20130426/3096_1 /TAXON_ID=38817 /ORGANISM="Gephyrocapsa oceanica, Strain RCC1303" /LENGTH=176 /DNA_ID=CAMNT_0028013097 /DNA_START=365 /DNA_END=897 /DNA_ORIENTATION=-